MPHIPMKYAPKLIWNGTRNFFSGRPLVVSFETTLSCNANCKHCDLGGGVANEKRMKPEEFRRHVKHFRPPVVQLSGGEPLLRPDIVDIVKAVKINPYFPYTILVSNAWMLNKQKYLALRQAGVNQFSISLDFPDDRHDDFRCIKGLYAKMDEVIPEIASLGFGDVVMNTAITSANVRELPAIIENCRRWGVCVSFSVYTPLRTKDYSLVTRDPEDLKFVREVFDKAIEREGIYASVVNSRFNLDGMYEFLLNGTVPNCSAGKRFLVIRPDGLLNPCSLQRVNFETQKDLVKGFSKDNQCGGCFVSIRSYVEVSFAKLVWENISMRVMGGKKGNGKRKAAGA